MHSDYEFLANQQLKREQKKNFYELWFHLNLLSGVKVPDMQSGAVLSLLY